MRWNGRGACLSSVLRSDMCSALLLLVEQSDLLPPPEAHTGEPLFPAACPDPMRSGQPGCSTNPVTECCVATAATRATLAHHLLCGAGAILERW